MRQLSAVNWESLETSPIHLVPLLLLTIFLLKYTLIVFRAYFWVELCFVEINFNENLLTFPVGFVIKYFFLEFP